jgi:hypothetical protein
MLAVYGVILNQDQALTAFKYTVSRQLGFTDDIK